MSAPSFDILYRLESQVETATKAIVEAQLASLGTVSVYQARESDVMERPCVGIVLVVGQVLDRYHLPTINGVQAKRLGSWQASLQFHVSTRRENDIKHDDIRARLRMLWQNDALFTLALLPYHEMTRIRENGTAHQIDNEMGTDQSIMSFDCIVSIRTNAWPTT